MGEGIGRSEIDSHCVFKATHVDFLYTAPALAWCTGVIDQNVEAIAVLCNFGDQGFKLVFLGYVADYSFGLDAKPAAGFCNLLNIVYAARHAKYIGAHLGKTFCDAGANTFASSGDDRGFSIQSKCIE